MCQSDNIQVGFPESYLGRESGVFSQAEGLEVNLLPS